MHLREIRRWIICPKSLQYLASKNFLSKFHFSTIFVQVEVCINILSLITVFYTRPESVPILRNKNLQTELPTLLIIKQNTGL